MPEIQAAKSAQDLPKIRIISDGRFPSLDTNTQQIMKSASALARTGLDIELCIPSRNRFSFFSSEHFRACLFDYYNIHGPLKIRRERALPLGSIRPERLTHGILTPIYALFRGIKIFYSRDIIPTLFALLLRRYVLFETYRCLGDDSPRIMRLLVRRSSSPRFLGIITHSQFSADSIIKAGFPKDKVIALHNGFDPEEMLPVLGKDEARRQTNLPMSAFLLVYTGNLHSQKGIESILELAALKPAYTFALVGGGSDDDVAGLRKIIQEKDIKNIIFTGRVAVSDVPKYLYAADVLLIPPTAAPLKKFGRTVLPFKTFLYMAAGRPILAPSTPDLTEVLDASSAMLVPPDDYAASIAAIDRLAESNELRETLSEGAKRAAAHLTWDARGEKIARWISLRYKQATER